MSKSFIEPTPIEDLISRFSSHIELEEFRKEDVLNLEMLDVLLGSGVKQINDTAIYLTLNGGLIDKEISVIPISQLVWLFDKANKMRPLPYVRYMTGLRVYFACKNTELTPLFQPIYLERTGYDPKSQMDLYSVNVNVPVYIFNGTDFDPVSTLEMRNWMGNYQSLIQIKHNDIDSHEDFIPNHDVESMVFSFQAIFTLMHDNYGNSMKLSNSVVQVKYDGTNTVKHRILLSSDYSLDFKAQLMATFSGKFANRSHLCPPSDGLILGYDLA